MVSTPSAAQRIRRTARPGFQPKLEILEDRLAPANYSLTDLGIPGGFSTVVPFAINNAGEIVAVASSPDLTLGEVELYSNGQWTQLAQIPANGFFPVAINKNGEILGEVPQTATTPVQLYTFTSGEFTPLNAPAGAIVIPSAVGLDDSGDVLADLAFANGAIEEALYVNSQNVWKPLPQLPNGLLPLALNLSGNGTILAEEGTTGLTDYHAYISTTDPANPWQDLGTPSAGQLLLGYVNDNGQVAVQTKTQTFLYNNGQFTDIGTPAGLPDVTLAPFQSFDNAGQVIANASVTASGPFHPYLYSNGQWIDLNTVVPAGSKVNLDGVTTINSNGQIIAVGKNLHAYLLTPLPPASPPPPSPPPAPGGSGGPGGSGSAGAPTPVPFIQAVINLYIDGFEKILGDSPAVEQSIQENLPWAVIAGIDIGNLVVLLGEVAATHALHGGGNGS